MRRGIGLAIAAFAGLIWAGCSGSEREGGSLTARDPAAARGMDCAACHAYPPRDTNHLYHLYREVADKRFNGVITCLDCHRGSLQAREIVLIDTFFRDSDPDTDRPGRYSSLDFPVGDPPDPFALRIRSWPVDTLIVRNQNRPVAQPGRAIPDSGVADFITALAHLNGTVDVRFDAKLSDPARFGDSASFNPKQETCSAVACHPGDGPYRFASPRKGLPALPIEEE